MEVAVERGDDRVGLVVPPLQHSLALQLHNNHYVQRVGIEVVVRGCANIHKALDETARFFLAQLACLIAYNQYK